MEKIHFTEWDTVVLEKKEIKVEKFFSKLDRLIETKNYSVKYKKDDNEFIIKYNKDKYSLELTDEQVSNMEDMPNIKHLLYLSRIEDRAELKESNKEISEEPLDSETKKFYLDILKKRKGKISDYLNNLGADLVNSIRNANDNDTLGMTMLVSGIGGSALGIGVWSLLFTLFVNKYLFLLTFLGLGLAAVEYVGCVLGTYLSDRVFRLIEFIDSKKTRRLRITSLEKELSMQNTLCIEDKQKEEVKELEIKGSILSMINSLIVELQEVNVENRENLREEIRKLLVEYMNKVNTTERTDGELACLYPEIVKKMANIEVKIGLAKKKKTERKIEAQYLLEKLDKVEVPIVEEEKVKKISLY